MFDSREKWPLVSFEDVVQISKGQCKDAAANGLDRYVGLEHIDSEQMEIRRWGLTIDGTSFTKVFKPGQVLFGKRRAYLRKVAVADFEGVCSGDIYVFEAKGEAILTDLIPFICQSDEFISHAVDTSDGTMSPRTNWNSLKSFEFRLPPMDAQHKLVTVLCAAERLNTKTTDLGHEASAVLRSLRSFLVKPARHHKPSTIGDVAQLSVDRHAVADSGHYHIAGVYSFGRGLLDRGTSRGTDTKYKHLHRVTEGQIVLSKLKAWEGAVAIAGEEHDGNFVSPEYPTFTLDSDRMSPAYMKLITESPWFWANITSRCRGTAERRARIHPKEFLKVRIYVPPLKEQEAIVERLLQVRGAINHARKRAATTALVKQSLLGSWLSEGHMQSLGSVEL